VVQITHSHFVVVVVRHTPLLLGTHFLQKHERDRVLVGEVFKNTHGCGIVHMLQEAILQRKFCCSTSSQRLATTFGT